MAPLVKPGITVSRASRGRRPLHTSPGIALALTAWLGAMFMPGGGIASADETVNFPSATYPPTSYQIKQAQLKGVEPQPLPGLPLTGRLSRPAGDGPFAAIVLMHGCGGIWRWNDVWAQRLTEWGYVVLDVDSFGPRGKGSICKASGSISGETRALDAHGAKTYLAGLPFVDPARIAVLGMSHGGWATLSAVRRTTAAELALPPFRTAVALYPWCDGTAELDAPLLILIGALDDWTPAERCQAFAAGAYSSGDVELKVYPGAHHLFDLAGTDDRQEGHILRYDPQAADDAAKRIAAFLAKHLGS